MKPSTFVLGTANGIAIAGFFGPLPEWSAFGLAVFAGLMMAMDVKNRDSRVNQ